MCGAHQGPGDECSQREAGYMLATDPILNITEIYSLQTRGGPYMLQRLRVPPGFPRFPREPVVSLLQLGAPTLCLRKRTPQSHLLYVGCCAYLLACFVNKCVRRWLWGIHLLQRLRVPPGFPRFPREPVVSLLQLGAPTLCFRKRTPQSHLLYVGNSVCLMRDQWLWEIVERHRE